MKYWPLAGTWFPCKGKAGNSHLGEFSYLIACLKRDRTSAQNIGDLWDPFMQCHSFLFSFKDLVCTGGTQRLRTWALESDWPQSGQSGALGWPPDDSISSLWSCSPSLIAAAMAVFQLPGGAMYLLISGPLLLLPRPHRPRGWPSVLPVQFHYSPTVCFTCEHSRSTKKERFGPKGQRSRASTVFPKRENDVSWHVSGFSDYTQPDYTDSLLWSLSLSPSPPPSKSEAHAPHQNISWKGQ